MSTIVDQDELSPPLPSPIRWRSWPARDKPLYAVSVVAILTAVGLIVFRLTGQTTMAWAGMLTMAISLWRIFLPVDYELSVGGVDQWIFGRRQHSPWPSIRGYEICTEGILLLPQGHVCPMDAFFGLYLPWSRYRDEVLPHLRRHLGAALTETALDADGSLHPAST